MFGDVNVKVEDGNLGRSSSTGTGTSIKIGISNVESKSPILISGTMNAKKIKEKVGNTPLADACIDAVEWGASSIYCIPVKAGTAGTIGKITEDQKGYGTFEVKGSPNNAYDIVVEVMDAGECNEGSFRYSLDGGNTFTEEMTIPITGEAELATTGLTAKFTDAEGGDSFMEGDRFTFSTTSPAMSNESVISAVESLINSPLMCQQASHPLSSASLQGAHQSLRLFSAWFSYHPSNINPIVFNRTFRKVYAFLGELDDCIIGIGIVGCDLFLGKFDVSGSLKIIKILADVRGYDEPGCYHGIG